MYISSINYLENIFFGKEDKKYSDDGKYEFRNIFDHSKRVYAWAERINRVEKGDNDIISIASLFHDVGKIYDNDHYEHAIKSRDICREYLKTLNISEDKKKRILKAIEIHPYKEDENIVLTIEDKILMDADLLDEVGILTLVWDSMATALEVNPSYEKVCERSIKYYNKICTKSKYLKTETGRKFYKDRLDVLERSINNLRYELNYKYQ